MIEIVPSILSADFARLAEEIASVERGGASMLHLDVMDGHFVPNLTIGPPVVESVRKVTRLHLDVHLMIENPGRYTGDFVRLGPIRSPCTTKPARTWMRRLNPFARLAPWPAWC